MGSGFDSATEVITLKDPCLHGLRWGLLRKAISFHGGFIFHSSAVSRIGSCCAEERQKTVSFGFR